MENHEQHSHLKLLIGVFATLICLTGITVWAAYFHFESSAMAVFVAFAIATLKVSLVAYYFMHLKWEDKLIWIFALLSIPFVAIFVIVDIIDIAIRYGWKLYGLS